MRISDWSSDVCSSDLIGSGPTNSMRGAAFLTGIENAIVMDVGGTTCDIGVLAKGFPRESTLSIDIGGVRTNFRDRKSVVSGKSVSVRVDLGGRRIITKKKNRKN